MNKWLVFLLLILSSCSSNKNFVLIDSANHATIEELKEEFTRSFGYGKLIGDKSIKIKKSGNQTLKVKIEKILK